MDRDSTADVSFLDAEDCGQPGTVAIEKPASPCVRICTLDDERFCVGCGRSMDEIVAWARMSAKEQWALLAELDLRRRGEKI